MPIYEYICEDCQTHFEKIVLNKTQEIACPKCAGKKNAIQLSVFSAANGSGNGASAKSSGEFSGGGGSCCGDRKSTRLNSSHRCISYAVFCLKKKKKKQYAIFDVE